MSNNAESPTDPQKEESSTHQTTNVAADSGDSAKTEEKKKSTFLIYSLGCVLENPASYNESLDVSVLSEGVTSAMLDWQDEERMKCQDGLLFNQS